MKTISDIQRIVNQIKYRDWEILILEDKLPISENHNALYRYNEQLDTFEPYVPPKRYYLQIFATSDDNDTGEKNVRWSSRKWFISQHMCENEIVRTVFKAIQTAELHEICEKFVYKGVKIFHPHLNYNKIVEISKDEDFLDVRTNAIMGV